MERKFESEIGNHLHDRKSKSFKKAILGIAAISACALMLGAASAVFAVGENSPVEITEVTMFGETQIQDQYNADDVGDADLDRVMSLKYKTTLPPGNGDPGNTKLLYNINMQVRSVDGIDFSGMIVGELSAQFDESVVTIVTVECAVTVDGEIPVTYLTVGEKFYTTDGSVIVGAAVPSQVIEGYGEDGLPILVDYAVSVGDFMSWTITVVTFVPEVGVELTESAWPGLADIVRSDAVTFEE